MDLWAQKEFGQTVAEIRAADERDDEYLVLVGETVAATDEIVAELTTGEDDGRDATDAAGKADVSDTGEGRGDG